MERFDQSISSGGGYQHSILPSNIRGISLEAILIVIGRS
jgi:hypothetical protein